MAFTETEQASHLEIIEANFWSKRRPPLDIRHEVREGQRFEGQSIELFLVRPSFADPSVESEESIAKLSYARSKDTWQIYWKPASGKWTHYTEAPKKLSLSKALQLIDEDANYCFFG